MHVFKGMWGAVVVGVHSESVYTLLQILFITDSYVPRDWYFHGLVEGANLRSDCGFELSLHTNQLL